MAIGAPYEDELKGAVYIFNGDRQDIPTMYSQKIMAADVDSNLKAFGFYLSQKPLDVDNNQYNGMCIS